MTKLTALVLTTLGLFPVLAKADPPRDGASGMAVLGFAPLSNEESWNRLPVEKRTGEPLPSWARSLAGPMPRLAASLLRLDYVHRAHSPLDSGLRARMRLGHGSRQPLRLRGGVRPGRRQAGRARRRRDRGPTAGRLVRVAARREGALEFARKMTVASSTVSDDEFHALVKQFDRKTVAAMVILMAYSNFQDRLLLCLGSPLEPGGLLPPVEVFVSPDTTNGPPKRPTGQASPLTNPTGNDLVEDDLEWISVTYNELQDRLERQRGKTSRVPEPTYDEIYRAWPAGIAKAEPRPTRIIWNLVCSGYQPEMASAWMACGRSRAAVSEKTRLDTDLREHLVLGHHALDQLHLLHGPL